MALTRFAKSGLNRLGYEVTGDGEQVVLLLHGLLQSRATMHPLGDALEDDATVIIMDLRGHGGSSAINGVNMNLQNMAEDAFAVLDAEGIEEAVTVVGIEVGAVIAQLMQVAHPERIEKLVLINVPSGDQLDSETLQSIANAAYREQAESALRRWLTLSWGDDWETAVPKPRQAAARRSAGAIHPVLTALDRAEIAEASSMQLPGGLPFAAESDVEQVVKAIRGES